VLKKIIWVIVAIIIALILVCLVILRVAPNSIPTDTPIIGKLTCPYPVKISGGSMEPALATGKRIIFDRCRMDKSNLSVGIIIAFEEGGVVRISRIIERIVGETVTTYKTAQDSNPNVFIHVPASDIIATYQE
jgi:signal peptidase I